MFFAGHGRWMSECSRLLDLCVWRSPLFFWPLLNVFFLSSKTVVLKVLNTFLRGLQTEDVFQPIIAIFLYVKAYLKYAASYFSWPWDLFAAESSTAELLVCSCIMVQHKFELILSISSPFSVYVLASFTRQLGEQSSSITSCKLWGLCRLWRCEVCFWLTDSQKYYHCE